MRFLLGLIAGALATLLVASAFNAPIDELRSNAQALWERLTAQADGAVERLPDFAALPEPADERVPAVPAEPDAEVTPPSLPKPAADAATVADAPETSLVLPAATDAQAPQAEVMLDVGMLEAPEPVVLPAGGEAAISQEAVVWEAFHSEASAQGFANRLARKLDAPFHVRKLGPAQYSVTYSYADEAERLSLRDRIAVVMGLQASEG